ncbi:MAG: blaR1 peptidase M56 family protein [Xanthomarina sp.]|uniref:M56 family metallopeptidase n=1 Tax=Xanthomarina sp. TaxID=1931211 RepID=UPI000C634D9B|nr:M56 family metallopeptidase [Xanthomarina sp.]MDX1317681.1 M56 family metallopeptidase [Xanthomarina gelatinilytica]MAL23278.1 blaR1 peptidase M56 family protein [Xanthomarina sp.]MBF62718.1 blaR1 peptidase M56 family protein [Xanthomarina sp.]HAB28573.1 blaR1 peptidase M56 family protein [Xanthomarina gelatinilytica]HAI17371.1 blaR1 peptidase M56 family protein [Xanthomarina gelatinilytica]
MAHYVIQVIAFQLFFLVVYDVFLKKETFFNWNRAYLLITAALSFMLPVIKIDRFKDIVPQQYIITLPEVVIGKQNPIVLDEVFIEGINQASSFSWSWMYLFYLGSAIAFSIFAYKLTNIIRLIYGNPKHHESNLQIVNLENSRDAFSFFNYIFIGKQLVKEERETILKHEWVHVKQKHSLDMLFFEILRIFFWFNPFIYMYQNRISVVHEFLADAEAVKHNKAQYYQNLLSQVFNAKQVSFINPFFKQSLIKKRIVMLQKSKSKQVQLVKYALLIPMVFGMLVYSSCSDTSQDSMVENQLSQEEQLKMIIESLDKEGKLNNSEKEELTTYFLDAIKANVEGQDVSTKQIKPFGFNDREGIPFENLDEVPVFPGCESQANEAGKKACFNKEISTFIVENFNSDLAKTIGLNGTVKISVFFIIGFQGKILEAKARAPHPELEAEAERVINLLPNMIPGMHEGKAVNVPYYLPIKFEINE